MVQLGPGDEHLVLASEALLGVMPPSEVATLLHHFAGPKVSTLAGVYLWGLPGGAACQAGAAGGLVESREEGGGALPSVAATHDPSVAPRTQQSGRGGWWSGGEHSGNGRACGSASARPGAAGVGGGAIAGEGVADGNLASLVLHEARAKAIDRHNRRYRQKLDDASLKVGVRDCRGLEGAVSGVIGNMGRCSSRACTAWRFIPAPHRHTNLVINTNSLHTA